MPKILVIDDDAALREIIQISLEHAGFEVIEADNGIAGVQQACTQLPDLILCDVRMERMDGYRTLAALRQDTATAPIPVILMTGMADPAGMRQGMELGADDYLSKPFAVPSCWRPSMRGSRNIRPFENWRSASWLTCEPTSAWRCLTNCSRR